MVKLLYGINGTSYSHSYTANPAPPCVFTIDPIEISCNSYHGNSISYTTDHHSYTDNFFNILLITRVCTPARGTWVDLGEVN